MHKRIVLLLALVALSVVAASCRPLPAKVSFARGELQTEEVAFTDAIPLDYGTLVGVVSLQDNAYTTGLWFQKADKTIVLVKVNVSLGKIEKNVLLLPRR